ncbi:NCS2 family permease [Thermomonospora umbrina]|uniref:AGZA family xanthine/uracil permease-like MFS transporter n=1 Tax=Thermomonospora umbrina TaxID=111806 RepID=A0A3D9SQE8_9ACTN|nr:NCS2 family permease [Thermomonospora umbrina]REE96710.1 AGZA family xanthine/uracil permease-like MFS transporter [Thermomonospora umbrina]
MSTDTAKPDKQPVNGLDRYFKISERGSTVARELRGGLATFFTMAYIVVLNPLIIGTVADGDDQFLGDLTTPGAAIPLVAAATALIAGLLTIAMGVVGRYPFAMATGLGLNAVVAFGIAGGMSWEDAMGIVVLEGLVIVVLVLTGFRVAVFHAIPAGLKTAIAVGIGLFIALIGFVDAGFVRRIPDAAGTTVPVQLGATGSLSGWPTLVFVVGLLGTVLLVARRVKGAILIGIVATTVFAIVVEWLADVGPFNSGPGPDGKPVINPDGWQLNVPKLPDDVVGGPDLGLLGEFSLFGSFERAGVVAALLFVFTVMLADFFDTMGTVVGVGAEGELLDEKGDLPGVRNVLLVDSVGAAAGGAGSVSSNTTYIESAAGVAEGARTGLASVVTGALFLVAMFFAPLVTIVPFEAATPALVVVGFLMMTQIRHIDFGDHDIAIPAFLTIVLMPFSYSITVGIGAGFVSYVAIKAARRRFAEIHPLMWLIAALFVLYFALDPVKELLNVT